PDDPESAAIELATLVGRDDAAGLVEAGPELAPLVGAAQLERCLPAYAGRDALSFPAVANRIRCRAVQRHAVRARGDALARLFEAQAALDRERAALDDAPAPAARMAIGAAANDALARLLPATPGLAALAALYDRQGARDV